ncbi:MAG: DNA alkylation repair protein [Candidatus Roizmanbacteria bacterium]|nr:DNA alkylation repair protein [Candidatus Roizmanbacteria bacterium]
MSELVDLKHQLRMYANPQKAVFSPRFFKSGKGEYGEGDRFIGVTVPHMRTVAKMHRNISLSDVTSLLYSPIHEERLVAVMILVYQFVKADDTKRKRIYEFYVSHTKQINNWDIVDSSADKIVGGYLHDKTDRSILEKLAQSDNIWEKRIAMIATYQFIKNNKEYEDTFKIAEILLHDKHDLIHKAVGWMLREVGKRVSREKEERI